MEKQPFILTFGSCGWDKIFYKNTDGKEGELVYEEEGRKNSHQALAAKRAGAKSMLVSFVGDDEIGKRVLESLTHCGIDTRFVKVVKGQATEINHQLLDRETRDYELVRFPSPLSQYYSPEMVEEYKDWILKANAVILVSKQNKDFLEATIDFCHEHKIPTTLTVSHKKFDVSSVQDLDTLKKVDFIAANFSEAQELTGKKTIEEMLTMFPTLIITKGGEGVYFVDENDKLAHEKAINVDNIVETNGAGDTFIGNFIVYYAEGMPKTKCVRMAQCASSLEIQKMGVLNAIPERKETEAQYEKEYGSLKELN